jgi:hypothetical protein
MATILERETYGAGVTLEPCNGGGKRRWANGEVPLVIPGVWAANEELLDCIDVTTERLNAMLQGHVLFRPRTSADRDYLVLHVTMAPILPSGGDGGRQLLIYKVPTLPKPTPDPCALEREFFRALGVPDDMLVDDRRGVTPAVVNTIKRLYPQQN